MSIFWLASYPKSGNTWLRAVLTNYLDEAGEPASINALIGWSAASSRHTFDEYVGLPSSDMTPEEILRHRPLLHEALAEATPPPAFVKVHEAYVHAPSGAALFPKTATAGVIYLVRNPLDVVVSYAHHRNQTIDEIVTFMNDPTAELEGARRRLSTWLPIPLLMWSGHVSSWLDQGELPVHVTRYEDLLANPRVAFGAIVRFAGLDWDAARLARAIDHAAFPRLRAQAEKTRFQEKQPTSPSFFRAGVAGSWRTALCPRQVRALVDAHGPVMGRFGYLRDAEAFLAGDGGGAEAGPAAGGPFQGSTRVFSNRQA